MGFSVAQSYLADILHVISQALLIPIIVLLILSIGYALFCIGSVLSEYFTERRHFKVVMPKFLAALMAADQEGIPPVIAGSGLLNRQKAALLTVYDYRTLPGDSLVALIRREVSQEEARYDRIRSRDNTVARVAPMIGLMGTLVPLGPGIEALGRADTAALSSSLLVAFDTTVAGLIVAAVCLVVGKVRGSWYDNYLSALDAAMATMLEKIEDMRITGEVGVEEPTDYVFMFERNAERSQGETLSAGGERAQDGLATRNPAGATGTMARLDDNGYGRPFARIDTLRASPQPSFTAKTPVVPIPSSSPAFELVDLPSSVGGAIMPAESHYDRPAGRGVEDSLHDTGIIFEPRRRSRDVGR